MFFCKAGYVEHGIYDIALASMEIIVILISAWIIELLPSMISILVSLEELASPLSRQPAPSQRGRVSFSFRSHQLVRPHSKLYSGSDPGRGVV